MEVESETPRDKIPPGAKTRVDTYDFSDRPRVVVWKLISPAFHEKLKKIANIISLEVARERGYDNVLFVIDCDAGDDVISSVEDCRRLKAEKPLIPILMVVSLTRAIKYHNQLKRAGFTGVVETSCLESVLLEAVQMTLQGSFFCDPDLVAFAGYKP